jgi:TetR/AcrR family transcriptional regulator, cholesterol catabolism regulator
MRPDMSTEAAAPARADRPDSGSSRREELLRIAARVFATKGIASATVRDIAQEAGILSGSLYHHFTSKEEMVREILSPAAAVAIQRPGELIDAAGSPANALTRCIGDAVKWVARNPDIARIMRNDAQYIRETPALAESERRRQANRQLWVDLVERGVSDGSFRADVDADVVVRAMWDGVLASIRWFPPLGGSSPDVIGDELATFYLAGVRATERRGRAPATRPASKTARRTARTG